MAANTDQSGDVTAWNQVVRGGGAGEPEPVSPVAAPLVKEHDLSPVKTSPEDMKKPVWNRKVNGDVESSAVVSPVMGTAWPALGESTKAAVKSSSSESLKTLSDGLLTPALQVVANCLSALQEIWGLEASSSEEAAREREALISKPIIYYLLNRWTAITQLAHHGMIFVPIGYTFRADMFEMECLSGKVKKNTRMMIWMKFVKNEQIIWQTSFTGLEFYII